MLSHVRNGKERMPSTTISKIGELVTIDVEKVEVANLFFFFVSVFTRSHSPLITQVPQPQARVLGNKIVAVWKSPQ